MFIKKIYLLTFVGLFLLVGMSKSTLQINAQEDDVLKPVDMMLVLDNSCSMFPHGTPGCILTGNDPEFLRLEGINLFVARLGFAEANELEYQAGVISLGRTPELIVPLQPVNGIRDAITPLTSNPAPETATNIMDAIKMAYRELRTSPNRRPMNIPAVVLLTDGSPYPRAGQSNAEIEQLVSANPDIPFFIMLLQDPTDPEYEPYMRFWEQMQTRYEHVFTYRIEDREQLEPAYNRIVAQLQNTIPGESGVAVRPGEPYQFFVSRCVREIIVTIQHEDSTDKGTITIQDPTLTAVDLDTTPGVRRFRGVDNPVEVISIGAARLTDDLKDRFWTITSDKLVKVHLDRRGAYRINFVAPSVSLTDITNVYLATERQTPSRELPIRFDLSSDCYGGEHQPIWGDVIFPDGQQVPLRIPDAIAPDSSGTYEIRFDFASAYPEILNTPGRFIFMLNAGSALESSDTATRVPIATARLLVDVGRAPYIAEITPSPLVCNGTASPQLTVTLEDHELAVENSIQIRAFGGGQEVLFSATAPDVFTADLTTICAALSSGVACSTRSDITLRLRLTAQLTNGFMPPLERDAPVQVSGPDCPPTPTPTPPPPTPPPPDRDGDGIPDHADRCPDMPGIVQLQGCPIWPLVIGGLVLLLLLFALIKWVIPWIKVHTCCPPPKGFILICHKGKSIGVKGTYSTGMANLTNRITIGGDRKKAHIYVDGLKPVEFYVTGKGNQVQIFDAATGALKGTFKETPSDVTVNADLKLRVGLDQSKLRC